MIDVVFRVGVFDFSGLTRFTQNPKSQSEPSIYISSSTTLVSIPIPTTGMTQSRRNVSIEVLSWYTARPLANSCVAQMFTLDIYLCVLNARWWGNSCVAVGNTTVCQRAGGVLRQLDEIKRARLVGIGG